MLRPILALLAALAALAPVAAAPPENEHRIDLVPMIGIRNGATLEADQPGIAPAEASATASFGLDADFYVRPDAWFEVFADFQKLTFDADPAIFGASHFDMRVDYLQFGGGYEPTQGAITPFVSAALGVTRYGADTGTVDHTLGFSGSIGGGFKTAIGKRLAFKLEVLGYGTINDAALAVNCGPGCDVRFAAGGWYQFEARAGLAIRVR
ncbi:MAG TPA: hypothetical protein VFV19_05945 [Candidatus Polarisedimenticolaceae bacterium]|nr:hypothetical protein [Candidatus Polarisedimenticolaceae bacterium]